SRWNRRSTARRSPASRAGTSVCCCIQPYLAADEAARCKGCARLRDLGHVGGLRSFLALHDLELHAIAFSERLEATALNRAVMHEHIRTSLAGDESESFGVVEPLHRAGNARHWNCSSSVSVMRRGRSPLPERLKGKFRTSLLAIG